MALKKSARSSGIVTRLDLQRHSGCPGRSRCVEHLLDGVDDEIGVALDVGPERTHDGVESEVSNGIDGGDNVWARSTFFKRLD